MEQQIEQFTMREVPPNQQNMQRFHMRIAGQMRNNQQYADELVKAIGLSVIPDDIVNEADQVTQLKALLKWYKTDFFKWCDKPSCG
jgi:hypothetical protein